MPTLAAIDIGSNAFRLVIATLDAERKVTVVETIRDPVRLGQDVFSTGSIAEETVGRAVEAFCRFRELIDRHGVKWVKAVATSATREAENKDLFIDRVLQEANIEIEVVSPEEEARLIHLAVSEKISLAEKLAALVDIGGGSAEITLSSAGQIMTTESFRMGAVRLLQVLEEKKRGARNFNRLVSEYADAAEKRIRKEIGTRTIDLCIGTGGNIESLGDLRRDLFKAETNDRITSQELGQLVKKLQGLSFEERIGELRLRPDRADVIVPASIVVQKILGLTGAREMQIPRVGLKDGLLIDMIQELYGEKKASHREQVMRSALQIGRKYMFDEPHGVAVAEHAARIFDETRPLHRLPIENKLVLEVAALLHDIGHFITMTGHHKHTFYLLRATPIIGLEPSQMAIAANVARYHRKSFPKSAHEDYKVLPSKDRVIVSKLAAILRLADALDTEHASRVAECDVRIEKRRVFFKLRGEGDLLLEKWSLARKSPMFEQVFSTKVVVEE